MGKFTKLKYQEIETKKISEFASSFSIEPLERGFANTLGNAVRRVLLSSIEGVAPFALKIEGVSHEFQTIENVSEDVVQLILNLKKVRFIFNETIFTENEVVRVSLKSSQGEVLASHLTLPTGVQIVNGDEYIATTSKDNALNLELFLTMGRGFVSFEENKETIKELASKMESKITGAVISIDSDFSPVVKVSYESIELNSSSATIEEKLTLNVETDGSIEAKAALAKAAHILISHLEVLVKVDEIVREDIFVEAAPAVKVAPTTAIKIDQLELSVRSYNCLKRAQYETIDQLAKITKKELENIKNLGKKSVEEIIEKLAEHGIELEEGE